MKQLTDEVFAQVREALLPFAMDARGIHPDWSKERSRVSLTQDKPLTVGDFRKANEALAALDTEQPVQVNAGYGELEAVMSAEFESHGFGAPESNKREYGRFRVGFASGWHSALTAAKQAQPVQVNAMLLEALEAAEKLEHVALVALSEATYELKVGNTYTTATDTYKANDELIHRLDKILNLQYRDRKREARLAARQAQPERAPLEVDMFWDHEDPETFGHDIETIASNYGLGDEIEIDCAKRMPGIKVRVIQSEPEGEFTWERIDFQEAAHGIKQGGQQ